MTNITVNTHDADPGCYIAGHHGQYAPDRLAELCEEYGLDVADKDDPRYWRAVADGQRHHWEPEDAWQHHSESADDLLDRLNDHTVHGHWHWQDGELFLQQTDVVGVIYTIGDDYDDAWQRLCENGLELADTDRERACQWAADEDSKCWEFVITADYAWPD